MVSIIKSSPDDFCLTLHRFRGWGGGELSTQTQFYFFLILISFEPLVLYAWNFPTFQKFYTEHNKNIFSKFLNTFGDTVMMLTHDILQFEPRIIKKLYQMLLVTMYFCYVLYLPVLTFRANGCGFESHFSHFK